MVQRARCHLSYVPLFTFLISLFFYEVKQKLSKNFEGIHITTFLLFVTEILMIYFFQSFSLSYSVLVIILR